MPEFIQANWIEIIGSLTGLVYLYYEYKANIKMWPAGIIMSSFYTIVFLESKIYAFACINIYYILAAVFGWIKWSKTKTNDKHAIIHTPKKFIPTIIIALLVVFVLINYLLKNYTDSPVPYGDSFVTSLSIVSMWMLAHKFVEQWILLIILNIFSVYLYFSQQLYPTSAMYLVYAIVSIFAYFSWLKKVEKNRT